MGGQVGEVGSEEEAVRLSLSALSLWRLLCSAPETKVRPGKPAKELWGGQANGRGLGLG